MAGADTKTLDEHINQARISDEFQILDALMREQRIEGRVRCAASRRAERLVSDIRNTGRVSIFDALLGEYGLGSDEGVALFRLSESLMRIPDRLTTDALIADKLVPADWRRHRGNSDSSIVNAITLALEFTAFCLKGSHGRGAGAAARKVVERSCRPVVRAAFRTATRHLADRFVLGSTIERAIARSPAAEEKGYSYSYDMLGEAALTKEDAEFFFNAYKQAITALRPFCAAPDFRDNRGVSIKLSALHPRYELTQRGRVLNELTQRVSVLARMAKAANMGLNIDAEEADRLELSLEVIGKALADPGLAGWDGFGIVVQAYGKAAPAVIDWLYRLAGELDRKIMIRLVKGAYWDTEIKRSQVEGIGTFPVYTRKSATDAAYICCAKKLLGMTDRIYPQFAGHNAHTVSAILELAGGERGFEFQRIHGMGDELHKHIMERENVRCRIYAPVGEHRELLPYLARRMLENGANASFVNQVANRRLAPSEIAEDPFEKLERARESNVRLIAEPEFLFGPERKNSQGWDLHNPVTLNAVRTIRSLFRNARWDAAGQGAVAVRSPSDQNEIIGSSEVAGVEDVASALDRAADWSDSVPSERARVLTRASDLFESRAGEIFALLCREAGKTLKDAVAELREAVDFLRYYSAESVKLGENGPLGIVACISPWNFPLAIFTGQAAGALAAGNGVIAKPAAQTVLIARLAVDLMHEAGVPRDVLQLVPGPGSVVGNALVSDSRISGVAFTGSTETAALIAKRMAEGQDPSSRLIAETGGLNAMIVDSTALPEQVTRDVLNSAFLSAGQRCSALRILYLQSEIADQMLKMLFGAMDEMRIGDPWEVSTDIGPVISSAAQREISAYIETARRQGRLLKQLEVPKTGCFVGPAALKVNGIEDLESEVFGPVLHIAMFEPHEFDKIVEKVNDCGYGLTFGLHSRIDERARSVARRLKVGNIYVNRNQIGAVVGSQPFGGEGLSGTGPKAGGPDYVKGFTRGPALRHAVPDREPADVGIVQSLLAAASRPQTAPVRSAAMPGPTGESNRLTYWPRGTVLCLGPTAADASRQAEIAETAGCAAVRVAQGVSGPNACAGFLPRATLTELRHIGAVALWSDAEDLSQARRALAARTGPIIPLLTTDDFGGRCLLERHLCIDITAAGGNAALFAEVGASD